MNTPTPSNIYTTLPKRPNITNYKALLADPPDVLVTVTLVGLPLTEMSRVQEPRLPKTGYIFVLSTELIPARVILSIAVLSEVVAWIETKTNPF